MAFYSFIRTFADGNGSSGNAELFFKPISIGLILINKAIIILILNVAVPLYEGHAEKKELFKT